MRAVIQRVERASVAVDGKVVGSICRGVVVLLAIEDGDQEEDLEFVKRKILNLRIFQDDNGNINLSLLDISGEVLIVSQFTLYGDCRKGNRPSYSRAAAPGQAKMLYQNLIDQIHTAGVIVQSGEFQAMMKLTLVNDGPVTLLVDSRKHFY